jgi:hypothetical protein
MAKHKVLLGRTRSSPGLTSDLVSLTYRMTTTSDEMRALEDGRQPPVPN